MIKDQCNNCKKNLSAACANNIVFDGTPCQDYVKKLDLSKHSSSVASAPVVPQYNPQNAQSTNNSQNSANSTTSIASSIFSFKGRIRRTQYWVTNFVLGLLMAPANFCGDDMPGGIAVFTLLIFVPWMWVSIANCVKRFHDLGKSGWFTLLLIVPIANIIFGIYAAFFKGEECDNQYGPNPY